VLSEEWLNGYPTIQEITTGHQGQKKLTISLPAEVWLLQAVVWVQARHALTIVQKQLPQYNYFFFEFLLEISVLAARSCVQYSLFI
jgi:hypothetical protein